MNDPRLKKFLNRNKLNENPSEDEKSIPFDLHIPKSAKGWATFFKKVIHEKIELTLNYKTKSASYILQEPKTYRTILPHSHWMTDGLPLFHLYDWHQKNASFAKFIQIMQTLLPECPYLRGLHALQLNNWEGKILLQCSKGLVEGSAPTFVSDLSLHPHEWLQFIDAYPKGNMKMVQHQLLEFTGDDDGIPNLLNLTPQFHALLLEGKVHSILHHARLPKKGNFALHTPLPETAPHQWEGAALRSIQWTQALCAKNKHVENSISFLISGPPGTGKTAFAHSLAHQIKGKVMIVNYAQLHSKWVGETEKNIEHLFRKYAEISHQSTEPIILLLNEADGLLAPRVQIAHSNDIHTNNIQIQLLEWLEKFRGILIATTNKLDHLDEAFHRRFLFKLTMNGITPEQRQHLLEHSPIRPFIPVHIQQELKQKEWNPGQWANVERKIMALADCISVQPDWVEELLREEGMLTSVRKLGFAAYRPAPPAFGLAAEG
jgi:hypothetical protein